MNIQPNLTKFRMIFKEKIAKINKNTEGVINKPRQILTMLWAILAEHSNKFNEVLSDI
jgi:hypothetical protein